jgi:hypothetical protein
LYLKEPNFPRQALLPKYLLEPAISSSSGIVMLRRRHSRRNSSRRSQPVGMKGGFGRLSLNSYPLVSRLGGDLFGNAAQSST